MKNVTKSEQICFSPNFLCPQLKLESLWHISLPLKGNEISTCHGMACSFQFFEEEEAKSCGGQIQNFLMEAYPHQNFLVNEKPSD